MISYIKAFLEKIDPDLIVQAPGRINLINPLDAVEADLWMPSVAIEGQKDPLSSFCYIKKQKEKSSIKYFKIQRSEKNRYSIDLLFQEKISKNIEFIKTRFTSELKLIYASIYRFYLTNSNFWEHFKRDNIEIGVLTTIPKQSGLGGSAAIIISVLYCFALFFNLLNNFSCNIKEENYVINKDIIAEMATKVEDEDLNITAGYGDRYVICRGGLAFCSYYGKLHHKVISKEPLAVYDKIDQIYDINKLPIIICYSGVIHESGNVHKRLRELYLNHNEKIRKNYENLGKISWKSRFALMSHDWKLLGELFKRNTKIMNEIMNDAGFKYGIGLANNILIKIIEQNENVYAAKLTGAGGGGSVFALTKPDKIDQVMNFWKQTLNKYVSNKKKFKNDFSSYPIEVLNDLKNAQFFKVKINKNGVKRIII